MGLAQRNKVLAAEASGIMCEEDHDKLVQWRKNVSSRLFINDSEQLKYLYFDKNPNGFKWTIRNKSFRKATP